MTLRFRLSAGTPLLQQPLSFAKLLAGLLGFMRSSQPLPPPLILAALAPLFCRLNHILPARVFIQALHTLRRLTDFFRFQRQNLFASRHPSVEGGQQFLTDSKKMLLTLPFCFSRRIIRHLRRVRGSRRFLLALFGKT